MFRSFWLYGLISTSLFAWGVVGHRVIAHIADAHLTEDTRFWLKKNFDVDRLVWIANWADDIKIDSKRSKPLWHYGYIEDLRQEDHIIWAIEKNLSVLQSKKALMGDKEQALKWVVHLVADLHQPLHISKKRIQGFVGCMVRLSSPSKVMSLHQAWDSGLIDAEKLSLAQWTAYLEGQHFKNDLEVDLEMWAKNSYKAQDIIVPNGRDHYCKSYANQKLNRALMPFLSWDYRAKVLPVLSYQLWLGGIHLANILNGVTHD